MISAGCEVKSQYIRNTCGFLDGRLDFAREKCEHFSLLGHKFTQT
jgi:hypothetical protein